MATERKEESNEMEPNDGKEEKMERGRTHARSTSQLPGAKEFTHQRRRLYASQLPRVPQEEEEDPYMQRPESSSKGAKEGMNTVRQLVESSMHLSVGIPCTTSMGQLAPIELPTGFVPAIRPTRSFEDQGTLVEDESPDELDKKLDEIVKEFKEGTGIFAVIKNPKAKVTFSESVKVEPVVPDPTAEPAIWVLRDDYVAPRVPRGQRRLMPGQYEYETHMREMGYEPKWDEESERTKREWNHRSHSEPPPERKSSKLLQMIMKK
ncbi:unnamed protein product [Caenorhabditis brenneri]